MISASTTLKNILKQNSSVTIDSGCTIEYNMNDMVNDIEVTLRDSSGAKLEDDQIYAEINGYRSFEKVFPYTSIVSTNRPEYAGIKYGILGETSNYADPKNLKYERSNVDLWYRTYYPGIKNEYKYFITQKGQGARIRVEYKDKAILTNKLVVKFETSHGIPQSGSIRITTTYPNGTYTQVASFTSANIGSSGSSRGVMNLYYTGSAWSFTESNLNTSSSVSIRGVQINVDSVSDTYLGVIEISPRWVLDISSDVINIDISKEASVEQGISPVGIVSANSISMGINKFNNSDLKILSYDKTNTVFSSDKLYLYKDIQVKPFFKVYYSGAPLSDSKGSYEKILQGTYYTDSWDVDEFGSARITALDGAKRLQQTFCPDILCKDFSSTAIIRRLLDSIGFSNYNINTATNEESVIKPSYWWTESNKTVWQAIQEICKDNQMVAVFDENNILQFYTRNYLYDDSRTADWPLNYSTNGSDLPNIASLNKKEFRNGNKLTLRWSSVESTEASLDGAPLWTSPTSWLGALALAEDINTTQVGYVKMDPISTLSQINQEILYSFSGYLLIDSEILEYEAIEYQYKTSPSQSTWTTVDIKNPSDVKKYISKAHNPTYEYFRPSGRIKIKSRGAFGTRTAPHPANINNNLTGWAVQNVRWA
jgi:hypothetical protein